MTIEIAKKNFPKGQRVTMRVDGDYIDGNTIENVCPVQGSTKLVVRIKWDDNSESIEDITSLSPQPNLSFLNS